MTTRELTAEEISILDHTANRAANGFYCGDSEAMQSLVSAGLMESAGKVAFCPDEYFRMTEAGRRTLRTIRSVRSS